MLDPISFAAGGVAVLVGKTVLSYVMGDDNGIIVKEKVVPPPPPPPMPMIKAKVRLFVSDMQSVISGEAVYQPDAENGRGCEGNAICDGEDKKQKMRRRRRVSKCSMPVITAEVLGSVKLRRSGPVAIRERRPATVNESPICADCLDQKSKLRHVT